MRSVRGDPEGQDGQPYLIKKGGMPVGAGSVGRGCAGIARVPGGSSGGSPREVISVEAEVGGVGPALPSRTRC